MGTQFEKTSTVETTISGGGEADAALLAEAVAEAVAGSRTAFAWLVSRYQRPIHALLERLCGRPETARDLAQETFVSAFQHLATFEHRSEFFTWLYRIACNHAFAARRRRKPVVSFSGAQVGFNSNSPASLPDPVATGTDVSARLQQQELQQQLSAALNQIDQRFREVVVLCDMQGLSYEEIAGILKIPLGTVRSRLHRGRSVLRQLVTPL